LDSSSRFWRCRSYLSFRLQKYTIFLFSVDKLYLIFVGIGVRIDVGVVLKKVKLVYI